MEPGDVLHPQEVNLELRALDEKPQKSKVFEMDFSYRERGPVSHKIYHCARKCLRNCVKILNFVSFFSRKIIFFEKRSENSKILGDKKL